MCTDFVITATGGGKPVYVNGHSMEFGLPLDAGPFVCARGHPFESPAPDGPGLRWTTKYGYVSISTKLPLLDWFVMDGMNEAGLSTASMWLPGSTYPATVATPSNALWVPLFVDWVLGNFATVGEVNQALTGSDAIEVWAFKDEDKYDPLHWPVNDATGKSIVVEFSDGKATVYDNPYQVLTNAPPFPSQRDNLGNYTSLQSAEVVSQLGIGQNGHGSGLRGIPGDPLPTSRFVRMFYLKGFARQPENAAGARNLALHLLDTVDIPWGITFDPAKPSLENADYTQWAVVKDLTNRILEYRRYGDLMRLSIDLKEIDLDAVPSGEIQVPPTVNAIDVTPAPVYLFTAPYPGDEKHPRYFYTIDPKGSPGSEWSPSGIAFVALVPGAASATPVRQYHAADANPSRYAYAAGLWTGSGWTDDNKTAFSAYTVQVPGTVPVYQYHYVESSGRWNLFYSLDGSVSGWNKDGVAFYVYRPASQEA